MLGLGAGITWILPDARARIHSILAIPEGEFVRTIVAIGPASKPKSAPGTARMPRNEVIFEERWPKG